LPVTEADKEKILRISNNKSIVKLSSALKKDLNKEVLTKMISAFLVLKANGHPDRDLVRYFTRREKKMSAKLGFKTAGTVAPSLLIDGEFRSLVMGTRRQMKHEKKEKEQRQRDTQKSLEKAPKNKARIGSRTITVSREASS
jgi:hypothetical protein